MLATATSRTTASGRELQLVVAFSSYARIMEEDTAKHAPPRFCRCCLLLLFVVAVCCFVVAVVVVRCCL